MTGDERQRDVERRLAGLSEGQRQELVERLRVRASERAGDEAERVDEDAPAQLSFAQERLWFLQELNPASAAYNVTIAWHLAGLLDVAALDGAVRDLVGRHEPLRTRLVAVDGEPRQVVDADPPVRLELVEAGDAERTARELAAVPFDLAAATPFRAHLLRARDDEHLLLLTIHHVAVDGWSFPILAEELGALYRAALGGGGPLPPLPLSYADYARRQRRRLSPDRVAAEVEHWRKQLAGVGRLELATDRQRPRVQRYVGDVHRLALAPELVRRLRALADAERTTLFTVLLAAFQAVLHRHTGLDDIAVGSPVAGRAEPELERLVGFFVNTLVLRTDLAGDPNFRELVRRAREVALDAYEHQELPFEKLVEELEPPRDLSHSPLFQVLVGLEEAQPELDLPGVVSTARPVHNGTSKFDLALLAEEAGDRIAATIEYNTDLFDPASIARFAAHLATLLESAAEDPGRPVSRLRIVPPEARAELLGRALGPVTGRPSGRSVLDFVHERVRRAPDAVAVVAPGEQLTYAELDRRASRLARRLRELGVGADCAVGVCLDRSIAAPVAVLAVLQAGGAYVPLDPAYPAARLRLMLEDADPAVVVTDSRHEELLRGTGARLVCLDRELDLLDAAPAEPVRGAVRGDALAYVIFTSGSTGRPRGVGMPHSSLVNLLDWQLASSVCGEGARTLHFTSLSFDVAFQELFATWAAGGSVAVVPDAVRRDPRELARFVVAERVERIFMPAVALTELAEALNELALEAADAAVPSRLREVITAGEALRVTPGLVAAQERIGFALVNQYGPTETHVVTAHRLGPTARAWPSLPPIGVPIANTAVYVLDRGLEPVPVGVVGELYLGGSCLARGYVRQPRLTAARFGPNPFGPGRLYRSGDLGRLRADGSIEFVGRADEQLKIRGFRVEPGEVEAAIEAHPLVAEAVVMRSDEGTGGELVAYVVPRDAAELELESLLEVLRARLPEYMLPRRLQAIERVPRTPSGKVARRELARLRSRGLARSPGGRGPASPLEQCVAAAWAEVLREPPASVDADFFACGGHSLLGARVVSRLRRELGVDVGLQDVFDAPTVAQLAARLEGKAATAAPRPIVALPRPASRG